MFRAHIKPIFKRHVYKSAVGSCLLSPVWHTQARIELNWTAWTCEFLAFLSGTITVSEMCRQYHTVTASPTFRDNLLTLNLTVEMTT
jgi:hypothetical protein